MGTRVLRVYADTSVYGGVFEVEFEAASRIFFSQVLSGQFRLITSPVLERELRSAPQFVRTFYAEILPLSEALPITAETLSLQEAYISAKVVTPKWEADALHVAHATVSGCQAIVSWNFRHIVHYQKIALYNAVNIEENYSEIRIHTPQEVIEYGTEDV